MRMRNESPLLPVGQNKVKSGCRKVELRFTEDRAEAELRQTAGGGRDLSRHAWLYSWKDGLPAMKLTRLAVLLLLATTLVCGAPAVQALVPATSTNAKSNSLNITVTGGKDWVDTGMQVQAGDKLHITAKGTVNMGNNSGITADGAARGWTDTLRALTVPSAGRGALVGRIGDSNAATPFLIGADGTVMAPIAGELYLTINSDSMQRRADLSTSMWTAPPQARRHHREPQPARASMTSSRCLPSLMRSCRIV